MKEQIKEVLKRVFSLQNVPDTISQQNCDAWDSLKHLNLIVELEEEFNISFEPEDMAEMKDLNIIAKKIQELK